MATETSGGALPSRVDTLVIGAGAAGLSLGRRVALSDSDREILIVDARQGYRDDRTWCFWAPPTHDLRHLVSHEWQHWRYADENAEHVHGVPGTSYQLIRGIDFYRDAQRVIDAAPSVELRLGVTVLDVSAIDVPRADAIGALAASAVGANDDHRIAVVTSQGTVLARHVVDTRPHPTPALLFQCFAGSEIQHDGVVNGGDTAVAGLMTRMHADENGFVFTYVLPLTATTALVEFTRFSREPLPLDAIAAERDAELARWGLSEAPVLRQESGVLPMGRLGTGPDPIAGVVLAGNGGGALRDATGYAFARIQNWASNCAAHLARGEAPVGHPPDGWVQRQMDRIFLQALRGTPERAPEYFMALGRGVAPARLLRFLTDQATALDLAAIIASLPLTPFLAQLPDRRAAALAEAASHARATSPDRVRP